MIQCRTDALRSDAQFHGMFDSGKHVPEHARGTERRCDQITGKNPLNRLNRAIRHQDGSAPSKARHVPEVFVARPATIHVAKNHVEHFVSNQKHKAGTGKPLHELTIVIQMLAIGCCRPAPWRLDRQQMGCDGADKRLFQQKLNPGGDNFRIHLVAQIGTHRR